MLNFKISNVDEFNFGILDINRQITNFPVYMLGAKHGFAQSMDCAAQTMDPYFARQSMDCARNPWIARI